jgi:hypothetical protein
MNEIYPFTHAQILKDCPKALIRIPVWGRGKSGKSPGKKHKRVIKDLGRIPCWRRGISGKLLPATRNTN